MKINVECRGENQELQVHSGARLLDYLQHADIPVNAACGGAGSCNKCRIKVRQGFLGVSGADRKAFSDAEIAAGWRLSCQARPRANLDCLVPDVENFKAKARIVYPGANKHPEAQSPSSTKQHSYVEQLNAISPSAQVFLACDLGSTGVVVAIGNEKGESLIEAHLLNRQVRFGADVMSRLKTAQDRGGAVLQEKIFETLKICLDQLEALAPELYARAKVHGLYCSGNSAMVSFLHGWNTDSLAVSPFQPLHTDLSVSHWNGLDLISPPLLGGFVGADTFAGIWHLENIHAAEPWMLVDIGTNTEVVINNGRNELWFSSAPAGPAFEGGNIAQGMRAEPGAISEAVFNGQWQVQTIGHDKAKGICGSGLLDVLCEAVRAGLITADGYLPAGRLPIVDDILLMADDVREFQLAKAATRTACDLLIDRAQCRPTTIYLAGTFAEHLKKSSIAGVGLLPSGIELKSLGNAALMGTLSFAASDAPTRQARLAHIQARRRPVELALQDDFQDAFVRNLNFT